MREAGSSFRGRWLFRRFHSGPPSDSGDCVSSPPPIKLNRPTQVSGFQTGSCPRPQKVLGRLHDVDQTVTLPQRLVAEPHVFFLLHPVLPTKPPSQPLGRRPNDWVVGRADPTEDVVVRPTGQHPVEVPGHIPRVNRPVSCRCLPARPAANALDTRLARAGANVGAFPVRAMPAPTPRTPRAIPGAGVSVTILGVPALLWQYRSRVFYN